MEFVGGYSMERGRMAEKAAYLGILDWIITRQVLIWTRDHMPVRLTMYVSGKNQHGQATPKSNLSIPEVP
jgi:hypothetical protein